MTIVELMGYAEMGREPFDEAQLAIEIDRAVTSEIKSAHMDQQFYWASEAIQGLSQHIAGPRRSLQGVPFDEVDGHVTTLLKLERHLSQLREHLFQALHDAPRKEDTNKVFIVHMEDDVVNKIEREQKAKIRARDSDVIYST